MSAPLDNVADKTQVLCDVLREIAEKLPLDDRARMADAVLELCSALEGLAIEASDPRVGQ